MEEANPSSLQPRATQAEGGHISHDSGANGRLGDGSIEKPMTIRPKQPDASADVRQDRGGYVDIGDSDNNNVSDTTTESDVNSILYRDGDKRRELNDTDTNHEQDADEEQLRFAQCPFEGCAEAVLADEMALHIDLHATLEYQKMPICKVGIDAPIDETYSDLPSDMDASTLPATSSTGANVLGSPAPSLTEFHESDRRAEATSSRPSSSRRRDDSTGPYLSEKENTNARPHHRSNSRRAQSLDGKHDSHRERRERHRTGRDSASPHSVQQTKYNSSPRKLPTLSARPWWAVWALNAPRKPAVANGKGKEVLAEIKNTPSQPRRLGKAELGKYADEERMPDKLAVYLKKEWGICHRGEPFEQEDL